MRIFCPILKQIDLQECVSKHVMEIEHMRMFLAIVIAGGFIIGAEENAGEKRKGLSQDDAIRQRLAENRYSHFTD